MSKNKEVLSGKGRYFKMVVREGLSEDLTVEQRHKMCRYIGKVPQVEGTANAKALKMKA